MWVVRHFGFLGQSVLELDFLFLCKVNVNNGFAVFVTPNVQSVFLRRGLQSFIAFNYF